MVPESWGRKSFLFLVEDADGEDRLCGDVFEVCVSGHCEQDSAVPVRCFEEFQIAGKKTDCLEIRGWFFKDKDDVVCVCGVLHDDGNEQMTPCVRVFHCTKWDCKGGAIEGDKRIVESAFARNVTGE